jgi:hypothetical protein
MYAIPKTLALLSVIFLPVILINTDKLHNTDNSTVVAVNANAPTTPHRVDMHMLASAFH